MIRSVPTQHLHPLIRFWLNKLASLSRGTTSHHLRRYFLKETCKPRVQLWWENCNSSLRDGRTLWALARVVLTSSLYQVPHGNQEEYQEEVDTACSSLGSGARWTAWWGRTRARSRTRLPWWRSRHSRQQHRKLRAEHLCKDMLICIFIVQLSLSQ